MKKVIFWLPRVLAIVFIAFISIFALDVFGEPQWYLALFMHLIPSFILIILTVIAWNRLLIGGVLFLVAGCVMAFFFHSLPLSVPVFVVGFLFIITARRNAKN